jgi:ketosteroid isomerase-like protein
MLNTRARFICCVDFSSEAPVFRRDVTANSRPQLDSADGAPACISLELVSRPALAALLLKPVAAYFAATARPVRLRRLEGPRPDVDIVSTKTRARREYQGPAHPATRFGSKGVLVVLLALTSCLASSSYATEGSSKAAEFRALVERQVQAWTKNDFSIGADDWAPDGELRSPGGQARKSTLQAAMADYFEHFRDLSVVVTQTFTSPDGTRAAIEWDWSVTRIRDGARGTTHDAIIVELEHGKIKSWREYFDFGNSVDASP